MKPLVKNLFAGIISGLLSSIGAYAQGTPLTITGGFNSNDVATSTTGPSGYPAFYDSSYATAYSITSGSFPVGQTKTGLYSGTTYSLAPGGANDALVGTGTLTFSPVTDEQTLYVLGESENGAATLNYTLNFSTTPSVAARGTISFADWYDQGTVGSSDAEVTSLGRIGAYGNGQDGYGSNFQLYGATIPVPLADQDLTLDSISITGVSGGVPSIFAVSGQAATPEPSTYVLLGVGLLSFLVLRRRAILKS